MGTGLQGTFVISWSQTDVDSLSAAPISALDVGATWSWRGEVVRVDGPQALLRLDRAEGDTNLRKSAARMVRRLVGAAMSGTSRIEDVDVSHPLTDSTFVVTNGAQSYTITLIDVGAGAPPLLMFLDEMPPRDQDLWVVHHTLEPEVGQAPPESAGGVICFTPGTRLLMPDGGTTAVEDLHEGDLVQTRDNGAQEVQWIGSRRMTGARLFAMPRLRPIRIRPGAFGADLPDPEFLVSPEHRMVVRGPHAKALFNADEVLVAAKDLVNGTSVAWDVTSREVTYVHLLLPRHEVIVANGVETESFHPANTALTTLADWDRERLLARLPGIDDNPHSYGGFARRNLSTSEAAILMHDAA